MKIYHLICVVFLTLTASQCGQGCIYCWDEEGDRCGICNEGLANLGDGICRPEADVIATITHSLPVENIVFMRSDMLYNAYETIWQNEDWYTSKLHTSIGHIFNDLYSDDFDVVYITSYEDVTGPVPQYYNQFFGIWPPFHELKGTVMWQKPSSSSIESWFGTHFHELGHYFLVHFDQYEFGKNYWQSHWGATGMDRWGVMGGFPLDQMTCENPAGAAVTENSCQASSDGKMYVRFPATSGAWASDGAFDTAEFSNFELFTMGLKTEGDLANQKLVHCTQGAYAVTSDDGDYVAACDSLDWLEASDLAAGLNDPIEDRRSKPFRAAHVVLLPDSQQLPTQYADLPSEWQQASDWLKEELPSRFEAATRGTGSISYFIADVEEGNTPEPTTASPTVVGATNEPTNAVVDGDDFGSSASSYTVGFLLLVLLCIL